MSGVKDMEQKNTNQQGNISKFYQEAPNAESAYICRRIEGQIAYYEEKSARNKRLYHILSACSIVANALVPVCSVFLKTADGNEGMKFLIAVLSSFALIATSLLVLFNAKELWNKYRRSANNLTSLLHQYYTQAGMFDGMEEREAFRLLAKMAEAYLDEENKEWSTLLRQSAKTNDGAVR